MPTQKIARLYKTKETKLTHEDQVWGTAMTCFEVEGRTDKSFYFGLLTRIYGL